jgi:Yip1 domain
MAVDSPGGETGPANLGLDGPARRLIGVFLFPVRTFRSIARRPGWLLPLVLWTAFSFIVGELVLSRTDWESVIRRGSARRQQSLSDSQIDAAVERSRRLAWVFDVFAALTPTVVALVTAGALWAACEAFGWDLRFRQSFGVTTHAFLPGILASLALFAMLWGRDTIDPRGLDDLVPTSPGLLVDRQAAPALHSLLSSLDLLSIWTMALLVIGLSEATGAPRRRMAGLVVGLWALYVLGKAGVAALFA